MKRHFCVSAALVVLQLAVVARADADHTFTLDTSAWEIQPKTISVAGDFNAWSTTATPMKCEGNVWSATVTLPDGARAYKFVADGSRWLQDPKADPALDTEDGNGGKNSVVMISAAAKDEGVRFAIDTASWNQQPTSINLAGDFNAWSITATPMKKAGTIWSITLHLTPGLHHYKFIADGQRWLPDPEADPELDADDGNGGKNSGIRVEAAPATRP